MYNANNYPQTRYNENVLRTRVVYRAQKDRNEKIAQGSEHDLD
jgi:hypothetical protein